MLRWLQGQGTYDDVDDAGDEAGPVSAPVGICYECSDERSDVANS